MLRSGWLSPDCVLHNCGYMGHLEASEKIAKKYGIRSREEETGSRYLSDDDLLAAGWFKITRMPFLGNGGIFIGWPHPYDDDKETRWRFFLKGCITEKHREYFRKAYFDDPSDWDTSTIIDFIDYGIIEKDEVINKEDIPEWVLK